MSILGRSGPLGSRSRSRGRSLGSGARFARWRTDRDLDLCATREVQIVDLQSRQIEIHDRDRLARSLLASRSFDRHDRYLARALQGGAQSPDHDRPSARSVCTAHRMCHARICHAPAACHMTDAAECAMMSRMPCSKQVHMQAPRQAGFRSWHGACMDLGLARPLHGSRSGHSVSRSGHMGPDT